jgi:hypothetical protein
VELHFALLRSLSTPVMAATIAVRWDLPRHD